MNEEEKEQLDSENKKTETSESDNKTSADHTEKQTESESESVKADKKEEKNESVDPISRLEAKFDQLISLLSQNKVSINNETKESKKENGTEEAVKKMNEIYGLGSGIFQTDSKTEPNKRLTTQEVAQTIHKIM